jgi:hypothetical protein
MNHPELTALIAEKLGSEIIHPGNGADQPPVGLRIPFLQAGQNPELRKQVDQGLMMLAEAIVHLIETDGHCDIVEREETP